MVKISKKKMLIKLKNQKIAQNREQAGTIRIANNAFRCHRVPKSNLTLWLDIDKTLVYTIGGKIHAENMTVVQRPGLQDFLKFCYHFAVKVNFFTADIERRTAIKTRNMGISAASKVLTGEDIKHSHNDGDPTYVRFVAFGYTTLIKSIPDFDANRTVIVDDIADFYSTAQRDNVIQIAKFKGKEDDEGLAELAKLFKTIATRKQLSIKQIIEAAERENPIVFISKPARKQDEEGSNCEDGAQDT